MKEVTLELIKNCANNLMFEMKEEEYETLLQEFKIVQDQFAHIGKIQGIQDVEPMTFPFPIDGVTLRKDEVKPSLSKEEALKNAKDVFGDQIRLPKVVN